MRAVSIFLALVLLLGGIVYYFTGVNPIQHKLKLGLDLQGGVHMVLEGVDSEVGKVTPEMMQAAKKVIEQRVNKSGLSEPIVQLDNKNRIIVELAGEKDPERARDILGKTAVLKFIGPNNDEILTGKDVEKAAATSNGAGGFGISLKLKGDGPKKFADATTKYVGQNIKIMLDEEQLSNPRVNEPIQSGDASITGQFTADEATHLADLINGGALPVKLELKENRTVSATLGSDSLAKSAKAGVFGLVGVVLFMLVLYRIPGLLANIALVIYAMMTIGVLYGFGAVFTLPGMAGLLLSIGMAVDGNIIIFERIKDELRKGKGLRSSLDAGFQRALPAVVDGQVTTFIAGVVLWYLGTGPIKGFAITMIVGVVLSLFSAITITRWLVNLTVSTGWFGKELFGVKEVAR